MVSGAAITALPLLLFSGGFSLPLGLPPLPEDPAISRAAPEECLAYISWAGTAKPDSKSTNQTEQLLAEPEVQKLLVAIDEALTTGIRQGAQHGAHEAEVFKEVYPLARTLLTRPGAVFVSKLKIGDQEPEVQGGAIFKLAEQAGAVRESLERLEKLLPPGFVENVEFQTQPAHRIKVEKMPVVTWQIRGKYLIVGVGEAALDGIMARVKQPTPPAWLAAVRKQLPVDRQSTLIYFNVKQAVAQFAPAGGPKVKQVLDAVGLKNVDYLASVTGLEGNGTVTRTLVAIDGEPQGIFQLAAAKPLAAADLSPIPRDATIAAIARLDVAASLDLFLTQIEKADPAAREEATRGIQEMEKELNLDLREDLLKPLGDVWCVYNAPSEGGLLITGLTGVVEVKDHDRLEATLNKLVKLFQDRMEDPPTDKKQAAGAPHRRSPRIVQTAFAGQVIYHLDLPDSDLPLAPAWCLTKKEDAASPSYDSELIVSTFPSNIKSYLSRGKEYQSLAAVPEAARALETGDTTGLTYCDTRKVAEYAYPLLCLGGKSICTELSREGFPLDTSLLPSAAAIFPHLQPTIGLVRRTPAGVEIVQRGTLAGMGSGPLLPMAFLWFAVRADEAPTPKMSSRAVSMNNLRQIALATQSCVAVKGAFPPAYISDKATEKPLLSWRVAILPYLDQQPLYSQFHLDEPWDSPHNKPLIARMPSVYRSPTGGGKFGTTRYLTLRHKDSAFPGKDGVSPAEVTHGLSHTILAVEADEAHAVIWTKPDDLEFDPQKPAAGLTGQLLRGFNAVFCDGSVRFFPDSTDAEVLRDMASRKGTSAK